jgi:hypothetical protein
MKKLCLLLGSLLCLNQAYAGEGTGKVTMLTVHATDIVMFSIASHNNKPACSTIGDEWALSLKTEMGRAMYSLLLSSAAQKLSVQITGDNTCSAWGDRENPQYIRANY